MSSSPTLVWFYPGSLRLKDHAALNKALSREASIIPFFVWPPDHPLSECQQWWLWKSLADLSEQLQLIGLRLILRQGQMQPILKQLIHETGATHLYALHPYLQTERQMMEDIIHVMGRPNCSWFPGMLLMPPAQLITKNNTPFQIFTPFWNALEKQIIPGPHTHPLLTSKKPLPLSLRTPSSFLSTPLKELEKGPHWSDKFQTFWQPGERNAQQQWQKWRLTHLENYDTARNFPALEGSSKLSPHLHFGEISARQLWWEALEQNTMGSKIFRQELAWREFAYHTYVCHPDMDQRPLRPTFTTFLWKENIDLLEKWQKGQTGYPIIDAGMRQLWQTGWMHNRVRMITASFLTKHLRLPWQAGGVWFMDTLLDADIANNSLNWQWVAGCGVDAAPYFRIFNPILQSKKFDEEGTYIRKFVPELSSLSSHHIHAPWESQEVKNLNYPPPLIEHSVARTEALTAYHTWVQQDLNKS